MPRPGGEADKLGNHFEAVWTVNVVLDVFDGISSAITVEPPGDVSLGVEFYVEGADGSRQFHSVKRQKTGGDWCIADLCAHNATGRSEHLSATGTPFIGVRLDSVQRCITSRQLGEQFDLPASPAVDQLDAMSLVSGRNPDLWMAFSELCDDVQAYPHMKMILACRDFDLGHDHRLRPLAESNSGFSKYTLGKLSKGEIMDSLTGAGMGRFDPSKRQLEILGVPFHLLLFLQGQRRTAFGSVGQLYDAYWERKQRNLRERLGRTPRWKEVVDALTERMSADQVLFAPKTLVDDWMDDAQAMVSEHVLVDMDDQRQYRFFHESFFDYAYARRFASGDRRVMDFLRSHEQHLFRRSQVRQILDYRREQDFSRYISDGRDIFEAEDVRFHIKRMVASGFGKVERPRREEWELLEP